MHITHSIIAAVSANGAIGKDNKLPWNLPEDLKQFKLATRNCTLIMGRKTFESIGKPLPGRDAIVLTTNKTYQVNSPNVLIAHSVQEAVERAEQLGKHVCWVGGEAIYKAAQDYATYAMITRVPLDIHDADAFFPKLNNDWVQFAVSLRPEWDFEIHLYSRPSAPKRPARHPES